ncbi:hypothetical protein C3F09_06790 [candidate division GN15 bacterium]|uniref:Glycosyltransferase RgtA/B/C/D-like domain-containing protein n=1 Tax=candidate division GN15 bacterium TaxID=2072418 RepID=A0A855X3J1_9BACT|nr:MAG: hypothetical protein C3F09_06790 [candidate division GN15 bacterium]
MIIAALLLIALGARLYDLRADPPAYFADSSQDVTTDGAYLTFHARNLVLFGQADLFDYHTWAAFKYSIVSGTAYLVFSLFGVSRITSGLVGVLLGFGALTVFLIVLARGTGRRATVFCAVFLCLNFLMWVYGRLPFSENGLMLIASLVFAVYMFRFDRAWGKLLVGLLIAAAGMFGKSFGFLLIFGPVAAILAGSRRERLRNILLVVVPAIVLVAVVQLTLYRDQSFFSFLWEHGAGEHGAPHGFTSVPAFFESLIAFGRKGLHGYAPVASVLAGLMLVVLLLQPKGKGALNRTELFMVPWLIGSIALMSPFNYLPLRYQFILIIPMAILAGQILDRWQTIKVGGIRKLSWWRMAALVLLLWYLIHYLFVHPFNADVRFPDYYRTIWYSAPAAAVFALVLLIALRKRTVALPARFGSAVIVTALAATIAVDGLSYYRWYRSKSYTIDEAAADLATIVPPQAVVSGQYGPALAVSSTLRSFPYFLTSDMDATAETFRRYPVTHVAVSGSTWDGYCAAAPSLKQVPIIARYWLRDSPVFVVRIASLFGNATAAALPPTDFERAVEFRSAQQSDSARLYLDRFLNRHPDCKQALMQSFELAFQSDPARHARQVIEKLVSTYPTDFVALYMAASYFHWLAKKESAVSYEKVAQDYLAKAIRQSPENKENLNNMYEFNPPDAPVIR